MAVFPLLRKQTLYIFGCIHISINNVINACLVTHGCEGTTERTYGINWKFEIYYRGKTDEMQNLLFKKCIDFFRGFNTFNIVSIKAFTFSSINKRRILIIYQTLNKFFSYNVHNKLNFPCAQWIQLWKKHRVLNMRLVCEMRFK